MNRRRLLGLGLAGGAVAVGAAAAWRWTGRPRPPSVLIVLWDTVRADRLSLHGYRRPTTPRLDARAAGAVVFERASSPAIWTLPAHASLFTGLPPRSHGADERWLWLDHRFPTLAERLAARGYATFSMAANALLCGETNLVKGFDTVLTTYAGAVAKKAAAMTRRKILPQDRSNELAPLWRPPLHGAHNAEWARAAFKDAAPLVVRTFGQWLVRQPRERPFFAFLNLMEAHTPRIPSLAARRAVLADDPELVELGLRTDAAHIHLHFYNFGKHAYSEREIAAINGVYDATLRDLDEATGTLFDELEARGYLEDTIVVLTSDHGENLGDHHLFNHRFCLWDTLVHVPLAIWAPGEAPRRVSRPVSTVALFSTLARRCGIDVPDGIVDHDLLGDAPGPPPVTTLAMPLRREIASVQAVHPDVDPAPWLREGHAVVGEDDGQALHKLIRLRDAAGTVTRAVYDLRADPGERRPVDAPGRAAALEAALDRWLDRFPPYDPGARGPGDRPEHVRASQDELRARLEAMGYAAPDD